MTLHNNISHHLLRTTLCLALLLCVCLDAGAQTAWDGESASASLTTKDGTTNNAGTEANPYLIASGEDLKYLQATTSLWNKCFLQTRDIDLGGYVLGMIGRGKNSDGKAGTPFSGTYDGGGNTIKNLKVDWTTANSNDLMSFGLFGFLKGATVQNMQIENAVVTRTANDMAASVDGLRIGVLAGTVSPTTTIKNIAIVNSRIEDGGFNPTVKAIFVGGVVGSVASDFTTIYAITRQMGSITIRDIYAHVDFNLSSTEPSDHKQLNIGGIVGRLRRPKYSDIPLYTFYTGTVNAPWGSVGPVFGTSRSGKNSDPGDNNPGDFYNAYTGEVITYAAETTTGNVETEDVEYLDTPFNYNGETIDPDKNRYFGDYNINGNQITATSPSYNSRNNKARTVGKDATLATKTTIDMLSYQGVNRGTYVDKTVQGDRQMVLAMLNTESDDNVKFVWNNDHIELQNEIGILSIERKTMHKFQANLLNLDPSKTYTYKWKITDGKGHNGEASIASTGGTVTNDKLKIIDADNFKSTCAIVGEFHPYNRIGFEVYDDKNELVASQTYDMGAANISIIHDVYINPTTQAKEHFLLKADVELDGHHIGDDPDFFEGVTCQWIIFENNDTISLNRSTTYNATPAGETKTYEAHIKPTYVGNLQLKVFSRNPHDPSQTPVTMSRSIVNGVEVDYIEQSNTGLHLSLTMEEYCGTVNDTIRTIPFDPAHYHVEPSLKGGGFYDAVYKSHTDSLGLITGITADTNVKPLIFKAKVVDQFGNDWTSASNALSHYRIQWNYRISGEGNVERNQFSPNYDTIGGAADGNYNIVNGRFHKDSLNYGLKANIADTTFVDYLGRNGHVKLMGDSILIIHPNLLHRTSAFWVRARLFDIEHDPTGVHPVEEILSFNQLAVHLEKNTTNNTIDGRVIWRQWNTDSVYVSQTSDCDLIWYKSSDPTNPNTWERVDSIHGSSRATTLSPYDPNYYYKLYYKSGFGLEAEQIIGPKNVVYVYDRAMTTANLERTSFNPYNQITNQYYPTGLVTNHGHDPHYAVATMEQAYKLLDPNGSVEDNIIVVMGYMEDANYLAQGNSNTAKYARRATITGAFGTISGSTIWMAGTDSDSRRLGSATVFKDITWFGNNQQLHFYCGLNDVTFDTGVKMVSYQVQNANDNGLGDYIAPHITIIAGFHNHNVNTDLVYPDTNTDPTRTTMTFRSGTFARIISGTRNSGGATNGNTKNVFGNPNVPHRVKVVVDIKEERSEGEKNIYAHDIGLLVGGQTDGTLYAESEIEMRGGSVGRYISGNISYGRTAGNNHPSDSFFGSTTFDMYGGHVLELYGGTLGRHEASSYETQNCDAYFYGRSIINIHNGTINSNIYGAGAGGVTGLGDASHHTDDTKIPYYNGSTLTYGNYDVTVGKTIPTMTLSEKDENGNPKVLNFANSYVEVNVYGGTIHGNIYGGGFGFSNHIPVGRAFEQAGYLFGNATVNISGGNIIGNVYGGGAGSSQYNQDPANNDSTKFRELACVYGNATVNISGGSITGSVYGGGQGILGFPDMAKVTGNTYVNISGGELVGSVEQRNGGNVYGGASLGKIRGNTNVMLTGGYIGANVFGGSEGDAEYPLMATIYGKTNVKIGEKNDDGTYSGSAIINASIYGGCNVSSIRKPDGAAIGYGENSAITKDNNAEAFDAMTKVIVNSGTIGNNIYGGSRGNETVAGAETDIEGDTYVRINGGDFINFYYLTDKLNNPVTGSDGKKRYRDFNIFGGGEKKCTIEGTTHLDVRSGLMNFPGLATLPNYDDDALQEAAENAVDDSDINIFIPHDENPNSLATDETSKFQGPYMDLTYRRFSIYGGGYGEQTNCLNTDVYVNIPTTKRKPHGRTLKVPYDHQSFFDIAGGGYSGDIGYWVDSLGNRVAANAPASDYDHYYEGNCKVTIDGFTYARKVIGGGFYGSCKTTDTKILCGSLRQAYGGSLLGYVHDRALLEIGNKPEVVADYQCETPEVNAMSNEAKAKWLNDRIFFTENVYGGNDVKGIVGTKQWSWSDGAGTYYGQEGTDGGPLWQADVDKEEDKGVVMNIFGGTFMGDVFGAGNGHYRGYYVPGWIRYEDGPDRMYRMVKGIDGQTFAADSTAHWSTEPDKVKARHRVYRTRPMVGSVNINITGNGADDMVKILGNFYGGGRECSIGQWNTILPMEDPRRLSTGGHLHINLGGNIDFANNFYMGVYGGLYGNQQYLPDSVDIATFKGTTTEELAKIGEAAYDHWYFNDEEGHKRYEPGFPAKGKADGNFGLLGEHMFRGYFKNIEMEGDVELTFYKDLYEYPKDNDGNPITTNGKTKRRCWLPAELAVDAYDAENITMNSFFLGGKCGYMTNNTYNVYCYTDSVGKHLRDLENDTIPGHNHEQWGSVYRIVMPQGVTIKDKLVMGVEDAVTKYYKYNDTFTAPDSTTTVEGKKVPDLIYTFEGGLVTQTTYSFDHVAYNDMMTKENNGVWNPTITLPTGFYQNAKYAEIYSKDFYTLQSGIYAGKTIYRRYYDTYKLKNNMIRTDENGNFVRYENNGEKRYGLAVVYNDNATHANGNESGAEPFFGRRASRTANGDDHQTVTKLTARCMFNPQKGTKPVTVDPSLSDELKEKGYHKLYGGIIYGGCYNSGVVIGDVILNVASNMLGKNVTPENQSDWFDHISGLGHYIGRVYGGGYGVDTRNDGDTYINLLRDVQAMNVFGGGMQGTVTGDTYINYTGTDKSYIYGAIYGGGFQGAVGKYYYRENFGKDTISDAYLNKLNDQTRLLSQKEYDRLDDTSKAGYHRYVENNGTNLTLISGNVDHVYGGSCMGDLYGATYIKMYDEVAGSLPHLDFAQYGNEFTANWPDARLIVGTVYGGNDISGEIIHTDDKYQTRTDIYDTHVTLEEIQEIDKNGNFGKTATPGAKYGYNGFPLVGNLYGGSNGNYGQQEKPEGKSYYVYEDGSMIKFASGNENEIKEINIGAANFMFDSPLQIPNVDRANIEIMGGTVVNLYGGGDMSTITGKTNIKVAYAVDSIKTDNGEPTTKYGNIEARAGFKDDADIERVWNTCHVTSRQQMAEVIDYSTHAFLYNIYRIFGGNNHADMAIQPSWDLQSGHVGSVYSGANFGKMTYYNPDADPNSTDEYKKYKGLALTINSRNFHANAVYGGGRVGDVEPMKADSTVFNDTEKVGLYGTTLTIKDGVIDHVYGGNDVSGEVHYGSKVDIQGAISGDVYCAGNGNYVYQYGYPADYTGDKTIIGEDYIITDDKTKSGYRYFILPAKAEFSTTGDIEKVKAINSYRPNVTRSNLTIGSTNADKPACVHGSIYMGGNSATVLPSEESNDFITFNIGSNVIINSIFMGSNGEHLVDDDMIKHTNERNNFNIGSSDAILNKYFEAVDVEGLPKNFALADTITNVNIGSFFLGGNRGSMTTSKTIELEFPENITIYGKIVGGSNNANYEYGMAKHVGGLKTPLADGITDKVHLIVKSKFLPKYLKYPDEDWRKATFEDNIRDDQGNVLYRQYVTVEGKLKAVAYQTREYDETNKTYTYSDEYTGKTYLPQGTCNIYGGCYNSGVTVGNIKIDLYSDMLLFGSEWKGVPEAGKTEEETLLALRTREQTVINCVDGLNNKSWHPFSVIGGGYGSGTSVYGDINVRLLPTITVEGADRKASHPSCGNVFGGAQEGVVVGNTTVELRDGTVLANVYGASESSYMYGSTQIFIGYPEHYECKESGEYKLARADIYSKAATLIDWQTNKNDNSEVVKRSVWYRQGDIVPKNVYEQIVAETANGDVTGKFIRHHKDAPNDFVPGATWDDINISVGDPSSRNARTAADIDSIPYFGYGNVYGGGFVPTAANSALIGQKTLLRFKDTYKPIGATESNITNYGGNSAIMIWDNPENAEMNTGGTYKYTIGSPATGGTGAVIKDHVSIGTGQFVPVRLNNGDNKMGLYYYKPESGTNPSEFVHQPSGNYSDEKDEGKTFYEIVGDGGIFGGGRKVYCEGFRACDLAYYGYADYAPQMAKLINSFQRIDLLSLTDCCLQLQASQDFASTTSDAGEQYSITRVGELRMNSSLAESNINLNAGVVDTLNIGNTNHNTPRSRNFLGFFRSVKFLGALVSNVDFTNTQYHDSVGAYKADTTYLVKKDSIVSAYYKSAKGTDDYEKFKKRNVGTSANMIGINNGYSLRIQGTRQKKNSDNNDVDEAYYGPALGVTEIKLLTMAVGEGGGYVYALNKHEEKPASSLAQTKAATDSVTPSFLQTLGNFVFPGANFGLKQVEGVETPTLNYIIDDCFPIGHGYDEYIKEGKTNVNDAQEIHYWYVNGQRYFYNATLTAYTGTPDGQPDIFKLDNSDNLIMLAGIDSTTQYLRVKSIKWDVPTGYSYDLTRTSGMAPDSTEISSLLPGYNLYVSVGDKPQTLIKPSDTNKQNAWVAELKRTDYTLVDTIRDASDKVVFKENYYDDLNIVPVTGNDNAGNGKYKATMPLLGLALTDSVSNNAKSYYTEHLSQPAKVQIVLGAKNSDGDYEYTLNLTIVYLKGTDISGHIVIENCALPGERIYANAFDVKVDGDDPTITNRKWVLYKIDTILDTNGNVTSSTEKPAMDIPVNFRVEEHSPERIAIPAYYWMNGWHLAYEMTVNGKHERVLASLSDTTEHKVITVHNYHRMMAWDRKTKTSVNKPDIQDLQLTSGARVYIEDADDLEHFLIYMTDSVQDSRFGDTDALKKLHRGHIGTAYLDETYDDIVTVNPQYAESIHFILLNDVKMKENAAQSFKFNGRLSGLGHTIDLNNCTQFMGENGEKGSVYFTGFLSKGETSVIGTNNGRVFGSFHYNTDHTGKLIDTVGDDDNLQYSFQNSYPNEKDHYNYTTYYDDLDFANGKAAYDLNAFYLNERYKKATGQPGNENDRFKSYVYNYYGDGEYRYANWDKANRQGTATALRTDAHPNYYTLARITAEEMDALTGVGAEVSAGIGAAAFSRAKTYHNCDHTPDGSRNYVTGHYVDVNVDGVEQSEWIPDYYEPNYPQDFMFWGQDIKAGEHYPKTIATDGTNRVFRASGFYGSQEDRGFYFNRAEAVMQHPQLTAVDFAGQRMRDGANQYLLNEQVFPTSGVKKQTIIFPPVLDLPQNDELFEGTTNVTEMLLGGMSVVGNDAITDVGKVTKNLLVYIPTVKVTAAEFPQDNETDIEAHRINWDGTNFSTADFHLVDKQDFNAPIAFDVTNRAWYDRTPEFYSSGNNAWEGLCLPFTISKVSATINGEITHFYGTDDEDSYVMNDGTKTQRSHEYWLRKFVKTEHDSQKDETTIYFSRPASTEDNSQNASLQETPVSYPYSNTFFKNIYGAEYERDQQPQYTATGATYATYRPITAGFPYLVTFPGSRYYEFDLSGEFYAGKKGGSVTKQTITYENPNVTINVSDEAMKTFSHNDYDFIGTFMHVAQTNNIVSPKTEIVDKNNDGKCDRDANEVYDLLNTTFKNQEILPFRAYLTSTTAIGTIVIGGTRAIEEKEDEEEKFSGVQLYVRGSDLVITSDHDFECPLYGYSGSLYRMLTVKAGMNVYKNLSSGVYIALGHKFVVRNKK